MNSWFALLVRHFIARFFDNEIVAQSTDMRTNMVQALGMAAAPGMLFAFYMLRSRSDSIGPSRGTGGW